MKTKNRAHINIPYSQYIVRIGLLSTAGIAHISSKVLRITGFTAPSKKSFYQLIDEIAATCLKEGYSQIEYADELTEEHLGWFIEYGFSSFSPKDYRIQYLTYNTLPKGDDHEEA